MANSGPDAVGRLENCGFGHVRRRRPEMCSGGPTCPRRCWPHPEQAPAGRAPAGYCWDEQKGGWFDDNGKPFELASSSTTPQGSGLQPSARQRWRRPNRSSPKPLPHPTPLLSPSTRLASTHLVRLPYLLHLLHLLHPHHTYSACYYQDHGKPEEQEAANHPSSNSASSCSVCAQSVYRPPLAIMTLDQRSGVPFIARAASKTIFVPPNN